MRLIEETLQGCESTYGQDDGGFSCDFGGNIDVHLEVGRIGSKVVDTSKSAICSCTDSSNAAEYGGGEVHLGCFASP